MALPTSGLTAHYQTDVIGNLFTTYVATGVHTGVPVNGNNIEVWDDTAGGIADQCLTFSAIPASTSPIYQSSTPLMAHPCLDFDGTNRIHAYAQDGSPAKAISSYITNSTFTVMAAFYPQAITTTNANVYNTEPFIADFGLFWGLYFRLVASVPKIAGYNWDGNEDVIQMTIATGRTWIVTYQHTGGNLKLALIDDTTAEAFAVDVPSGNTTNLTNQLSLGQVGGTFGNFRIGEFAIWNTALSGGTDLQDAKDYFMDQWMPAARAGQDFNALLIAP